ncbi:MAG: hypothetical protein ACLUSV_06520 [Streptococcus sp.]
MIVEASLSQEAERESLSTSLLWSKQVPQANLLVKTCRRKPVNFRVRSDV